jgi:polar amino acid transport system substrate-binding protein
MHRFLWLGICLIASSILGNALAQSPITSEIAPTGKLRVAMNAGTPVLVMRTPDGKVTGGVGVELGRFIADKLGIPFELVAYPNAEKYTQTFGKDEWDIGFGAKTPLVAEKAEFISDVLLNDYWYLAAPGREFTDATQIDRPGVKIGVGQASTSDQFLTRTLKSAELVRRSGIEPSVEVLKSGQVDAWAASASNIQQLAKRVPGSKIVPGAFMSDGSMVILPKKSSSAARAKIAELISEAKKAGIVTKAIEQVGVKGVRAAP